ncbi:hypothetical protein [Candidatus Magnetobacterium casense]|uniref:Uncharacterized protein n=1 Tax=Candidatus Magnetobacterium casense TaxID=1455061 RepID=A0ABS6RU11_9BACT|nr:hypothetical protein [Candidatus Magnetobacterium casensis]MBV6340110.1 hypothetical protein [Candidatus Magnetobacterium casensis]
MKYYFDKKTGEVKMRSEGEIECNGEKFDVLDVDEDKNVGETGGYRLFVREGRVLKEKLFRKTKTDFKEAVDKVETVEELKNIIKEMLD